MLAVTPPLFWSDPIKTVVNTLVLFQLLSIYIYIVNKINEIQENNRISRYIRSGLNQSMYTQFEPGATLSNRP